RYLDPWSSLPVFDYIIGGRLCQARHSTLQEVQHSPVEGVRLLDVAEAPGSGDERELGRIGNPKAFFAPPLDRTPLATPRWRRRLRPRTALPCRPERRGCLARSPRGQGGHGAAWRWLVLDRRRRMGEGSAQGCPGVKAAGKPGSQAY